MVVPGVASDPPGEGRSIDVDAAVHEVAAGAHDERGGVGQRDLRIGGARGLPVGERHPAVEALGLALLEGAPNLDEGLGGGDLDHVQARRQRPRLEAPRPRAPRRAERRASAGSTPMTKARRQPRLLSNRSARASTTSRITASSGSRSHRNVTTQSAQADVPSITHSSQLIRMPRTLRKGCDSPFDGATRTAPPALHRVDPLAEHRGLLHGELPTDRVVVEGTNRERSTVTSNRVRFPQVLHAVPSCDTRPRCERRRMPRRARARCSPRSTGPAPPDLIAEGRRRAG